MFISLNGDASAFSDINTQPKDKVNIHRITAYNKTVHKTTPTPTPYFGKNQEDNPARTYSTHHSARKIIQPPQTVEICTRNVQPQHTPHNQLTTEILGIDHRHICTSSPLVVRFHDAPNTETEN